MTTLYLFPPRIKFVDSEGRLTSEAIRALGVVFERLGGAVAPSTTDLAQADDDDSGLEEFKHEFGKGLDGVAMAPRYEHPEIQQLQSEMSELRSVVAELLKQIQGLQEGTTI